jgi:hypothetical protein
MNPVHVHPCSHCKTPVDCRGEQITSTDARCGLECLTYHRHHGLWLCRSCDHQFKLAECHDCGELAAVVLDDHDDASGYRGEIGYCVGCAEKRGVRV